MWSYSTSNRTCVCVHTVALCRRRYVVNCIVRQQSSSPDEKRATLVSSLSRPGNPAAGFQPTSTPLSFSRRLYTRARGDVGSSTNTESRYARHRPSWSAFSRFSLIEWSGWGFNPLLLVCTFVCLFPSLRPPLCAPSFVLVLIAYDLRAVALLARIQLKSRTDTRIPRVESCFIARTWPRVTCLDYSKAPIIVVRFS